MHGHRCSWWRNKFIFDFDIWDPACVVLFGSLLLSVLKGPYEYLSTGQEHHSHVQSTSWLLDNNFVHISNSYCTVTVVCRLHRFSVHAKSFRPLGGRQHVLIVWAPPLCANPGLRYTSTHGAHAHIMLGIFQSMFVRGLVGTAGAWMSFWASVQTAW